MNFFAVLLLSLFISVKSSNAAQDGTFDKNTKINMKSSTARAQDEIFHENAKTNVKSPTATQDGTFHENAKTNVNSSTATEEGTFHENAKRNGNAGLNVVLRNDAKQESRLTRFRRSLSDSFDLRGCYRHYFVGRTPPTGFKTADFLRYMHICQGKCFIGPEVHEGCFSTLYDLTYKIPIYAAYVLWRSDWGKTGDSKNNYWQIETNDPDLSDSIKTINEHIESMYSNTHYLPCIHKGHLVPAEIYSFTKYNRRSTFVYTNAVPQYQKLNSGGWSTYEEKIRNDHKINCFIKGGNLYLLTGISDHRIGKNINGVYDNGIPAGTPIRMPEEPNVVIPNSMWTAGCCVSDEHVHFSFAVIGNNDPIKDNIYLSEVEVNELEGLIGVSLFPGNYGCGM